MVFELKQKQQQQQLIDRVIYTHAECPEWIYEYLIINQ